MTKNGQGVYDDVVVHDDDAVFDMDVRSCNEYEGGLGAWTGNSVGDDGSGDGGWGACA